MILQTLARDLVQRGGIDLSEGSIDASFSGAKKGDLELVKQSAAKGPRSWQLQTASSRMARPHEKQKKSEPNLRSILMQLGEWSYSCSVASETRDWFRSLSLSIDAEE